MFVEIWMFLSNYSRIFTKLIYVLLCILKYVNILKFKLTYRNIYMFNIYT